MAISIESHAILGSVVTRGVHLSPRHVKHGHAIKQVHVQSPERMLKASAGSGSQTQGHLSRVMALAATQAATEHRTLVDMAPKPVLERLELSLQTYDPATPLVDLLVVGAGPAGLSVAQQVASKGLSVVCVDPMPDSVWPNNYGVWVDEFEALGLTDCLDYVWPKAVVFLDTHEKKNLDRPYGRVNRRALKTKMATRCVKEGVAFHTAKASSTCC